MEFIAHKREKDGKTQSIKVHLENTARQAGNFAKIFGAENAAYICALSHDIGKYSEMFQNRIKNDGKKCDHATAGAQRLYQWDAGIGNLFGFIIMGHHGGMPDYGSKTDTEEAGTFSGRIKKKVPDYCGYKKDFSEERFQFTEPLPITFDQDIGYKFSFFVRMLFSCVVDADFLDTEDFMKKNDIDRSVEADFSKMKNKLDKKISQFRQDSKVNQCRSRILNHCIEASAKSPGMFQLTVPTGGGKTIASAAFAINHLLCNQSHIRRIIYVIPYTSIIEQNGAVFADIFGKELVLEHHSNYDFESSEDDFNSKKKLASENWDMPLIITTNVQFFESLYANKPSKCRKLHNIAGSIIIFDEVQAIPTKYLQPCMRAIQELVENYHCSAVLCSATQPKLKSFFPETLLPYEICQNVSDTYQTLKRAEIQDLGKVNIRALVNRIEGLSQVLIVLNTKRMAKYLFELLKKEDGQGYFHLSTYMCPKHRQNVMKRIRQQLDNGSKCIVISTNLIEAGVDLDFPVVYRELTGLDSIIQTAGRANREGKREIGNVCIFSFMEEEYKIKVNTPYGKYLKTCSEITQIVIREYEDIFSPEAMDEYYTRLYMDIGAESQDEERILKKIRKFYTSGKEFRFNFKEIARNFKLIDDDSCSVLVGYDDEAEGEIENFKDNYFEPTRQKMRSLQKYIVNIHRYEYENMIKANRLLKVQDNISILIDEKEYLQDTGLNMDVEYGVGLFF